MDALVTDKILTLLAIATTFSAILMALVQKVKSFSFIKTETQVLVSIFLLSFLGILFGMNFYDLSLIDGIWVSLFSFLGAPSIYQILKSQNILTYKPKSLEECKDCIKIDKENVINRDEVK